MTDEQTPATSPTLPVNEGLVNTAKDFSGAMTLDLTDEQIKHAWRIIQRIKHKYEEIFRRKFNDSSTFDLDTAMDWVSKFEDEIKYELGEKCDILATADAVSVIEGQPIRIEFIGVMPSHGVNRYGMDHERKEWEVKRATQRGENFLGEHNG